MKTLVLFLIVFINVNVNAATCSSLGNGAWNNPATWSCGVIPGSGDTITINVGHTVVISTTEVHVGAPMFLYVDGTFLFDSPGAKLHMPCGSGVIISGTGIILSSGVGMPSHNIKICDVLVWEGPDGPLTGPTVIGHNPLPVELLFFEGNPNGSYIDFEWRTATELDNDYFTIEGSEDGELWTSIDNVNGAGTSSEEIDYEYSFNNRHDGFQYFRLSQTDFNGAKSYSYVISVKGNNELAFEVFPNPMNSNFISINTDFKNDYSISIVSDNGQVVFEMKDVDNERYTIHDLNIQPGVYIVNIDNGVEFKTMKLIKL